MPNKDFQGVVQSDVFFSTVNKLYGYHVIIHEISVFHYPNNFKRKFNRGN